MKLTGIALSRLDVLPPLPPASSCTIKLLVCPSWSRQQPFKLQVHAAVLRFSGWFLVSFLEKMERERRFVTAMNRSFLLDRSV